MYYGYIELIPKQEFDSQVVEALLWQFLCALERNGQITKAYTIVKEQNYRLFVTFTKENSFAEGNDGIYVRRNREKVKELFDLTVTILGVNLSSSRYCNCAKCSAIEMVTHRFDEDSPFVCMDCGRPVALYELPLPEDKVKNEDYTVVQNWQESYSAVDTLWMNGLCDRYSGNQLVKLDSALNKQGILLAKDLEKKAGCKVYYHLSCAYGKSVKAKKIGQDHIHYCPSCGELMERKNIAGLYSEDFCHICALCYDAH